MTLEQTIQEHVVRLPAHLRGEVLDYVLFLEQKTSRQASSSGAGRRKFAVALERLASMNPFGNADPVAWQREQRLDRNLPGRD